MSQATIEKFYAAFAKLDDATMAQCYAIDASFEDEAFSLRGRQEIGAMWGMLCEATRQKGRDVWKLETSHITDHSAHWDAHYRFSATGRLVLNKIDASFTFTPAGLIASHRDRFNFWSWSRQALGTPGLLLGWTPFLRGKVRSTAAANLKRYMAAKMGGNKAANGLRVHKARRPK
jgi:hypothetical protein